MKIAIDMQGAQSNSAKRGIGRYTMALVSELLEQNTAHEIHLIMNARHDEPLDHILNVFQHMLPRHQMHIWHGPVDSQRIHSENTERDWIGNATREALIETIDPDLLLITSLFEGYGDDTPVSIKSAFNRIPTAVIYYDVIPYLYQDDYLSTKPHKDWYFERFRSLQRADLYLAISDAAKLECETQLSAPPEKVFSISGAATSNFQIQTYSAERRKELLQSFGISRDFVLYIGGLDKRKNVDQLIRCFADLPRDIRESHQFVFAGYCIPTQREQLVATAREAGLHKREMLILSHVADDELVHLYNLCKVFAFPSWHEGFGLPALEAMLCGAVVVGANTTSLPEVIGTPEAMFNPHSYDDMRNALIRGISDKDFRKSFRAHSKNQVRKFSWEKTAAKTWEALENFHADNQKTPILAPRSIGALTDQIYSAAEHAKVSLDRDQKALLEESIYRSIPILGRKPQLFVDISELYQRDSKTGIQRVVKSILENWLESPPEGFDVQPVYASETEGYRYARSFISKYSSKDSEGDDNDAICYFAGDKFVGLDLQFHIIEAREDDLLQMKRAGVDVQVVVYDLLCILHTEFFPSDDAFAAQTKWLHTISKMNGALCISESVADELREWVTKHHPERLSSLDVNWFHLGSDIKTNIEQETQESLSGQRIEFIIDAMVKRPTFVMVGTLEPRKGHELILDAFDLLRLDGQEINLMIAGKPGWKTQHLEHRISAHPEFGHKIFRFGSAPDNLLKILYQHGAALIAASHAEGFGLPLIEAARNGLPVIARDIPVFREVAQESAFYFSGTHPDVVTRQLSYWLELYENREHPRPYNMKYMTWAESSDALARAANIISS